MRAPRIILIATAAMISLGLPPTMAEDSSSSPQPASTDRPVQADQPRCARWTDECVNCTRDSADGVPVCSNIGMACQPKKIRCLADAPAQEQPQLK
ncbi:MAG: hypothetical protein J0G28_00325 [Afipia sp.]|nr:hypothetical protein [Afipia sp.]